MNLLGIALLWCVIQVTLIASAAAGIYLLLRRFRPAAAAPTVLAALFVVVMLSLFAISPWPRWCWRAVASNAESPIPQALAAEVQNDGAPIDPSAASVPAAGNPLGANARRQPSSAALFWQALSEEFSRPHLGSTDAAWRWPAVLAGLMLTAMFVGLAWLALGIVAVRWQRRHSRLVDDSALLELIAAFCRELSCRRPVEVRECDDLSTAATIGWRRPTVLLPRDWQTWSDAERRAILAHEIAHARGHDYLALLCGQLGVMLHFYHPFVHWLMNRLRLEQELAADAAAASVSGGQRQYLKTIAELALRRQDRPLRWPVRCFLPSRSTFLRRIAMLRDSKLQFENRSRAGRVLAVGAVMLCGLLVAGLRGPSGPQAALADDGSKPVETTMAAHSEPVSEQIDLTFIPATPKSLAILRPAAAAKNPALSPWVEMIEKTGNGMPKGPHLADVRQITCIFGYDIPQLRQIVIYQFVKPTDVTVFNKDPKEFHPAEPEYAGKKMYWKNLSATYSGPQPVFEEMVLQYDDRTLITAGSPEAMTMYLKDKRGALPPWLPTKQWKEFDGDHLLIAGDMSEVRLAARAAMEHGPDRAATIFSMFSPVWEASKNGIAGLRIGDDLLLHATVEADDQQSAEKIEKTAESLRVLGLNAIDALQKSSVTSRRRPVDLFEPAFKDLAIALQDLKIVRSGLLVEVKTSVGMATIQNLKPAVDSARNAASAMQSTNNLKQLALAMFNYESAHKQFPPAVLLGPDGKTPYSWRVAILPFMEQKALYDQYHFDEPWDSPANRKVLDQLPAVYRSPADAKDSKHSSYFALTGPATIFDGEKGCKIRTVVDGLSHTVLLVETKRDIPWTKPEDIAYHAEKPVPDLHGFFDGKYHVALADGSVHFFAKDLAEKTLRLLIGKADRVPVETPPEATR